MIAMGSGFHVFTMNVKQSLNYSFLPEMNILFFLITCMDLHFNQVATQQVVIYLTSTSLVVLFVLLFLS